jgi:hypothetical protein
MKIRSLKACLISSRSCRGSEMTVRDRNVLSADQIIGRFRHALPEV